MNTVAQDLPQDTRLAATESGNASPRVRPGISWLSVGERFGLPVLLGIVIVVFTSMQPETFATAANWRAILSSQAVTLVLALALMVPLLSGNFDLSVGAVALLSAMVSAGMMFRHDWNVVVACGFVLGLGLFIGAVNGLLVTKFGLNGLIATLGSATVIGGLISWYSNNISIASGISQKLTNFGTDTTLGVPTLALASGAVAVAVAYVITQTPFGRMLVSIGSSAPAARLVGVRVNGMVLASYVVSGGLAGLGGVMLLAQQGSASPGTSGIGIVLPALAAVFLGASTWSPGKFNVVGTVLGLLLVSVTVSGLTLSGAAPWVNPVCYGGALILAVGASSWFRRRSKGA
jgi:ribose transport system permease protein